MKIFDRYIIGEKHLNWTLWDYLRKEIKFSRRNLNRLKSNGLILLNGEVVYKNRLIKFGDEIKIFSRDEPSENVIPEFMELDIIYEDTYIIAINKAAGLPVHPTRRYITGTIANGLVYYWNSKGRDIKIMPINRLDKNTSGILLFAKNPHIQHLMAIENAIYLREYIAIVEGYVSEDEGIINKPIAKEPHSIKRIINPEGQNALTLYKVKNRNNKGSLLKVQLCTGRTHQIRVHMSSIGHPIFGDDLYGGDKELIKRQALHGKNFGFVHPITKVKLKISAPLPKDIKGLCSKIGL